MGLHSIVYVSVAVRALYEDELIELLTTSRERNHREGFTGVLLYSNGRFIQCIEGPAAPLQKLFADIRADARHKNVTELVNEPIDGRDFGSWTMGYVPLESNVFDDLLASSWPIKPGERNTEDGSKGKQLLQIVWKRTTPREN